MVVTASTVRARLSQDHYLRGNRRASSDGPRCVPCRHTNDTEPTTEPTIEATIDRYLVMWNEADDAIRSEQARAVCADDGRLVDPLIEAVGARCRSPPPSASCATRCPVTR